MIDSHFIRMNENNVQNQEIMFMVFSLWLVIVLIGQFSRNVIDHKNTRECDWSDDNVSSLTQQT